MSEPLRAARLCRDGEPLVIEEAGLRDPSGDEVRVELEFRASTRSTRMSRRGG